MKPLPHQERTHAAIIAAIQAGEQRICVTAPTGAGKSLNQRMLLDWATEQGWQSQLLTNRKALLEQTTLGLAAHGIEHGIRASGYVCDFDQAIQLSSIQTEHRRVAETGIWQPHLAKLGIIDEGHQETQKRAETYINSVVERGGHVVCFSATPTGIGHLYTKLIVGSTNSELREAGLLVKCLHYAPDEPDMRSFKPNTKTGEYTENDVVKAIMTPTVFGRVYDHFNQLNRDKKPTILFGPDVKGSMFFAEQFERKGVKAAHVDGENVWLGGKTYPTTPELRAEIFEMSRTGEITVLANRFVCREGLDLPHLQVGIAATVFGSISSFLQSGGRLLRQWFVDGVPQLDEVTWIDHGGNFWRHGSLNADREWHLEYGPRTANELRAEKLREKKEEEPICCPVCFFVRLPSAGKACPQCGHEHSKKSRMVVQTNGKLVPMYGDIFKPRKVETKPDTQKLWEQAYYRGKKSKNGMNWNQIYGLFYKDHGYYPPKTLDLMPKDDLAWTRRVRDVAYTELRKSENDAQQLFQ